jgi:hypothetical protein
MMQTMTKNKLVIIPTIVLSSALLLSGCTSGGNNGGNNGSQNPTSSSASASDTTTDTQASPVPVEGFVTPPANMTADYKAFYMAPTTTDPEMWGIWKNMGATTYKEDPAARSTTADEWNKARDNKTDFKTFDKMHAENTSDIEQSALNVSAFLEKKPSASVDELNNNKDLIINRYPNVGSMKVEQDNETKFYFVVFRMTEGSATFGILVPQKGITPDFSAATSSK